jgi:DNA polymerase elongation subunit (family B)
MELKGRVNINLNRICEMELKLRSYTLESVVNHLYHTQISDFTDKYLSDSATESVEEILAYLSQKIEYEKLITHELNVIGGIVEKSKVYGADFLSMVFHYLSRCKEEANSK